MNTNDLRNRQIREILDEDIGIYKQVMDRQFKSVEAYKEEVSGKKERDLEAEVSIEKIIQQLQIKLQREVQQAEYLLSSSEQRWDERKNDKDIDNIYSHTGEILTLYNSAMRLYLKVGLSKDSQESIKIKLMQLLPFLNASNQALESVIDFMFSNGYVDNKLFWIFNTKSILETIKNQIEGSRFKIIDNSDVMATFKNLAGLQSQERIQILKRLMNTTTPLKIRTFFNYPLDDYDLMDKVQQLEAEMGVDFSNLKKNIKGVPIQKTLLMIDEAQKNIPLYKVASQRISELVSEVDNKNREINDLEQAIIEAKTIFDEAKVSYDSFSRREKELKPQAQTAYKIYKQTQKLEQQFRDIQAQLLQMNKEGRRRRLSTGEERAYAALQNQFENIRDLLRGKDSDIALEEFNELKEQYGQVVVATDEAKALLDDAKNTRDRLINELKLLNKEIGDLVKEYDLVLQQEQLLQRNVQGIEEAIGNVLQTNKANKRELQQPPSFSEERLSKEQKEFEVEEEEDADEKAADEDAAFIDVYGNGKKNKKLQYKDNKNDIYKFMVKNKALLIK
jgi:hypothetical protein